MRSAFDQVEKHLKGLGNILNNNTQAMSQGFMANDIWLETMKRVLDDVVTSEVQTKAVEVDDGHQVARIDWEHYWNQANEHIMGKLREASKARKEHPPEPLIERDEDDENIVTFGGDYAGNAEQEEGAGESGHGDGCGCCEDS